MGQACVYIEGLCEHHACSAPMHEYSEHVQYERLSDLTIIM